MDDEEKTGMRKRMSGIGMTYFIFALLSFGIQVLMLGVVQLIAPKLLENSALSLIISMLPMYGIAVPICMLLLSRFSREYIKKKRMKPGQFLAVIVMTFSCMYIGNIIGLVLTAVIGLVKGSPVSNDIADLITGTDLWGTVLVAVILAPIMEEWLFRKLLIDRVVKYGEGVAVLLSGLMFGLFHGNLNQFFYAFFMGMLFAFVYVKTGQIWYTVLLHMIVNFFGSVVALLVMNSIDLEAIEALASADMTDIEGLTAQITKLLPSLVVYGIYILFLLGIVLAGVILFALNRRKFVCNPGVMDLSAKEKRKATCFNVGMVLYTLFWVIIIIVQFLG